MVPMPFTVTVHPFPSPTPFSCAYERGASSQNALVFIGGLTSGPHTTPQLETLITSLANNSELKYSCWEFRMRSSYTGFGYSSLTNDAEDIGALVKYLKELGKKKIVLLGSSTGCQDIMQYVQTDNDLLKVDAYILQAPTSDRETATLLMPPEFLAQTLRHAQDMIIRGEKDGIMPKTLIPPIFTSPTTAYRWHSLIAKGGDDDFFSSDLSDATLRGSYGKLDKPTLIVPSENDEMVPSTVDKQALLRRWIEASPKGLVSELSGLNPGADHEMSEVGMQEWFAARVIRFLMALSDQV